MQDHTRDPCPWVILNDFGGAFAMGVMSLSSRASSFALECVANVNRLWVAQYGMESKDPGTLQRYHPQNNAAGPTQMSGF